jgi:protein-disulfide isomerase
VPRSAPQPRRSPLLPFYVLLGVVAVAGAGWLIMQSKAAGAANTLQPVTLTLEQQQSVPGISQGNADAPLVVMEFADFQCPACGIFARFSKPLVKPYIDNGTIRFVWYDFPIMELHKNAVLAARAGRCANEQNGFWPMHDVVFARQSEWSESNSATDLFIGYAQQSGLERGAFAECLRSEKFQKEVSESYELGRTLGVSGTPTLLVNGKRIEAPGTTAEWEQLVQSELGSARPAAAAPAASATDSAGTVPAAPAADSAAP